MDIKKLQTLVVDALEDVKAQDIKVYDTTHLTSLFDRICIVSGTSNRQTKALAASVREKVKENGGDVIISGEVRQFFVEETSTYKGHVLLRLSARNRADKTLWSGVVAGDATRFGHSYSAENYYEVFSDSIISAVSSLLQEADFRAALARK